MYQIQHSPDQKNWETLADEPATLKEADYTMASAGQHFFPYYARWKFDKVPMPEKVWYRIVPLQAGS